MPWTRADKLIAPRIVSHEKSPRLWLWILALVALGLWTWQVYDYGFNYVDISATGRSDRELTLRERIDELEREREELLFLAARHERASQIDREAVQSIQGEIRTLQGDLAALEREASDLRTLVTEGSDNLQIRDFSLRKTGDGARYRYLFTVSREIEGAKKLEGWVSLRLSGQREGEPIELSMPDFTQDDDVHRLGFKHYQKIEGDLQLPSGFTPEELMIDVRPAGTQFKSFTVTFDWTPTAG
jgi:hypothetical protein